MRRWLSLFLGLLVAPVCLAQDSRQTRIDAAINAAKQICLVGARVKFNLDVHGKLTITKILPGGEIKATVDTAEGTGGVLFEREEIRQLVDADIRKCMADQWPQILNALEGKFSSSKTIQDQSNARKAFLRELLLPVIGRRWTAQSWGGKAREYGKITLTRDVLNSEDLCRIKYKQRWRFERPFDPAVSRGPSLSSGSINFYKVDEENEKKWQLKNTSLIDSTYTLNVDEITKITILNFTKEGMYLIQYFGTIPNWDVNSRNEDLYLVKIETAGPRISHAETKTERGVKTESQIELNESILIVATDESSSHRMADAFRSFVTACDPGRVDKLTVAEVQPKPPTKIGEGFHFILEAIGGGTLTLSPDILNPKSSESKTK